jgi:hypothetical protein
MITCHWIRDQEKKVKQRNRLHCLGGKWPFVFLPLWLLNTDARSGMWTGGLDPSIHRRWHLAFHLVMGALRPPVVILAEGRVLVGGRAVSHAVPP